MGGGLAKAAEGKATHTSPGAAGAHAGRVASPFAARDTKADLAGSAAQRRITVSPREGDTGSESTAAAEIKGHAAVKRGDAVRAAPLGEVGGKGRSVGAAQPSVRVRHEKGGGDGVGEGEPEAVGVLVGVCKKMVEVGVSESVGVPVWVQVGEALGVTPGELEGVPVGVREGVGEGAHEGAAAKPGAAHVSGQGQGRQADDALPPGRAP